jgi:UDP-galactopyranose mutase
MKRYDYVIIGAGLFGSVMARGLTDAGKSVLVLEKRGHIGGNCYTEDVDGIHVHKYGPHIFHTSNKEVWTYIQRFTEFNHFSYRPRVRHGNRIFSFPINMLTFHQLWGVKTPLEAVSKLIECREPIPNPNNFEEWALAQVGREIYELFFKGYTQKQWDCDPTELPVSIIKRIPIRLTYDDNYYFDPYQGIPVGGYTGVFERLLEGVEVRLNVDYFDDRQEWESCCDRMIYTGRLDEFFECRDGVLDYRYLRFEHERIETQDYQGVAGMNYTSVEVPFTRIVEHKHFEFGEQDFTVITREYPVTEPNDLPCYPVDNPRNRELVECYRQQAAALSNVVFGGRLAEYRYYNMDQIIGLALEVIRTEL